MFRLVKITLVSKKMHSILIGGKAGAGVKSAGKAISDVLSAMGYYVFVLDDYQSLIKGGHNFNIISFDTKPLLSHYQEIDAIIALDEKTVNLHKSKLKKSGEILYDLGSCKITGKSARGVPADVFVKEVEGIPIMKNVVLLGALASVFGINFKLIQEVIKKTYSKKTEQNIQVAKKGYDFAEKNFKKICSLKQKGKSKELMTGNEAIALGAVKAGLKNYIAYPMTPSTSILHYLAQNSEKFNVNVVQPENETSSAIMAIGSAYAGAKTMIGTSGGGFALMTEAVSLMGMSETPVLIIESQRPGPSTGVPTYTAQADLNFVINSGHGDFPRIILAPGTNEEAFFKSAEAMNLAWKYQTPVILLSDKHLSESMKTFSVDTSKVKPTEITLSKVKNYKRYAFSKDGISPLLFPGTKGTIVKSSGYEHDEYGITTEEPEMIVKMNNKRLKKMEAMQKEIEKLNSVNCFGKGKNIIITWGSTIGATLEAAKTMKNVKVIQPVYLMPFPAKKLGKLLNGAKKIVCVELNATGQLVDLIFAKTGIKVHKKILKYDGREFEPSALSKELKRWLK